MEELRTCTCTVGTEDDELRVRRRRVRDANHAQNL